MARPSLEKTCGSVSGTSRSLAQRGGHDRRDAGCVQCDIRTFLAYSAWDEHVSVTALLIIFRSATWRHAKASNFSPVVDRYCVGQIQACTWRNKRIQIHHRSTVLPEKRMLPDKNRTQILVLRGSYDLSVRIDEVCIATGVSGKHAEINGLAVPPEHSVVKLRRGTGEIGFAGNVTASIDPVGQSSITAKRAKVDKLPFGPQKRMRDKVSCQIRKSHYLAPLIH